MDDPGASLADLTRLYSPVTGRYQGYESTGSESPFALAYQKQLDETGTLIGPGGRNQQGLAYSWLPYDPLQSTSGIGQGQSHTKLGPTYDDPVWGKLQSTYTEPSKAKRDRERTAMLAFAAAVSAITAGTAAPLIGTGFSAATQYGMTGGIDPKALAIQAGMSMIPGGLAGIDPSLAQAYKVGTTALGAANVANQARRGNYDPALNAAAGIGLRQLTGALG